jgi:chromosome segregation ATPase
MMESIKDQYKSLQTQLKKMELQIELKDELDDRDLKAEIEDFKSFIEKCNEENDEKDKIIKKINKELEKCIREKEESKKTINKYETKYLEIKSKYDILYVKYKDSDLLLYSLDESNNLLRQSNRILRHRIEELEKMT